MAAEGGDALAGGGVPAAYVVIIRSREQRIPCNGATRGVQVHVQVRGEDSRVCMLMSMHTAHKSVVSACTLCTNAPTYAYMARLIMHE